MITLKGYTANRLCLSSDQKPTDVDINTIIRELDTNTYYYFDGSAWNEIPGGGGGGGGFTPTQEQLDAMNSGITSEDVEQISTNKNNISNVQTSLAVGSSDNGKVLTASYSGGTGSYAWVTPSGGGAVSGVKGSEETNYRTGNVSISAANVGAIPTTEKGANNGVAALDSNGKIAAETLKAGALASGMTATTQAISDDSTKLATTAYVHDVVDALPSPMVFKGTLGSTGATISALPIDGSAEVGDTYKVVADGTYVVEIDGSETYTQDAKRGDIFICRIKETSSNTWTYIPSGDEPSGTVTNVAVANSGGLTVSGSPITSSGTITVGHSNSVTAKTSSSVKKFTYDAYGHVTGSSELSTAESNALASGIDSTKVAQIETNTTNILWTKTTLQFSATAADTYEYTGLSIACPANTLLEIWAIDDNSNSRITAIAVTDSNTSIDAVGAVIGENAEPLTMDAGAQWAREVHCVTPRLYGSIHTYYVWVKRVGTGANNVTLLTRKIVTQ